jgi:hypothetical protein
MPTFISTLIGCYIGTLIFKYLWPKKKVCISERPKVVKKDGRVFVNEEDLTVAEIELKLKELRDAEQKARSEWCDLYYKVNGNRGTVREIVEAELLIKPARKKLDSIEKEEKRIASLCKKAIRREIQGTPKREGQTS